MTGLWHTVTTMLAGFRIRRNLHRLVDSTPNQNCILVERLGWHVPLLLSRLIRERQVEQDTNSSYNLSDSLTGNSSWTRKIEYNSSGLVTDGYDARGVHTTFSYDDLNRVTQISYSDSTPAAHYYYDSQGLPSGAPSSSSPDSYSRGYSTGRLVAMTYGSGATGNYFGYDNGGRVVQQFQLTGSGPAKYKLSYSYNYAGMLTGETYPSNRALAYAYDEGGRLASVGDGTTTFADSLAYADHGGLQSETFGNGMVHGLDYNRRLQAKQVTLKQNSGATTPLQQYDYGYGEFNASTGNVDTSKNNGQIGKVSGTIGSTAQWNQGFSYDELGRLANVAEHQGSTMTTQTYSQGYTYDRYGNKFQSANTTLGVPAVSSSEINAATNRFITSGSTPTTYDAAGNISTDTKFRSLKYDYDANGRQTAAKLLDNTNVQSSVYDCAGQRVQTTAGSSTRTMVYDIFGQDVADYLGSSGTTLERENIYRGGQLLATSESLSGAAPSALAATPSSSNISLSWTAASGATKYRVERTGAGGSYGLLTTTTTTSTTDSGASSGSAYLYRVCAADGSGNCTSDYSNIALGARLNFTTDATIVSYSDNPATATSIKAAHITELRTAINAVRSLAGQSSATWTHSGLASGDLIYADDVRDLRARLNDALVALNIQTSNYTDNTIVSYADDPLTATTVKAVHIRELRTRATSGSGNSTSGGGSGGLKYVLSDIQGTTRAVMNNNGSSSAIIARHDYLPFGEEIGSNVGLRSSSQGYSATDTNRFKYGLTERDSTTGLDHTWWRKYESFSGRWTSPDPLGGSISNPQTFNHYSYTQNDPVNFVDPNGLDVDAPSPWHVTVRGSWLDDLLDPEYGGDFSWLNDGGSGGEVGVSGGGGGVHERGHGPQNTLHTHQPCEIMASNADKAMYQAMTLRHETENELLENFDRIFSELYVGQPVTSAAVATNLFLHPNLPDRKIQRYDLGQEDFRSEFRESGSGFIDQTHHFATYFSAGLNSSKADILYALTRAHRAQDNAADARLGRAAFHLAQDFKRMQIFVDGRSTIGGLIKARICEH
jgi:RHS repeat-associated protein